MPATVATGWATFMVVDARGGEGQVRRRCQQRHVDAVGGGASKTPSRLSFLSCDTLAASANSAN